MNSADPIVGPRLHHDRAGRQYLIPVPGHDLLADVVGVPHQAPGRFGDALDPETVPDAGPGLAEPGPAQHPGDLVQHLGERQDLRGLVDDHDVARRVCGGVQTGGRGGDGVTDDDRGAGNMRKTMGRLSFGRRITGAAPLQRGSMRRMITLTVISACVVGGYPAVQAAWPSPAEAPATG